MKTFLEEVTTFIYERHQKELGQCCVVFPNKRAGLFFRKALAAHLKSPLLLPDILTINDLFTRISGIHQAENFTLAAELYRIYSRLNTQAETFDEFFPWAETLIADFDDLDKYLVDARQLFTNLSDLRELDQFFNFPGEEEKEIIRTFWRTIHFSRDSGEKKSFLAFWNLLYPLYEQFTAQLRARKTGYEGMIFRDAIDRLRNGDAAIQHYRHFFFIGLNALSPCEKELMHRLQKQERASFFWDYDPVYVQHKEHEAGFFMRENLAEFGPPKGFSLPGYFPDTDRKVSIIPVTTYSAQAKLAGRYLHAFLDPDEDMLKTAVVFADEKFLMPMLQSIPEACQDVNVTMGYPVSESLAYGFLSLVLDLQKSARQTKGAVHYYHRQVLSVLHHPFIFDPESSWVKELIGEIKTGNHILVSSAMLQQEAISGIFTGQTIPSREYPGYLQNIIYLLIRHISEKKSGDRNLQLEKEVLHRIYLSLEHLKGLYESYNLPLGNENMIRLIRRMLQSLRVAFSGEPLAGIQLLGLLETRVLDFDNLILFPVNEGILPKSALAPSFVPPNLRHAFGMPTLEHQDAIFAYYFYRLLHRSRNIILLWNSGRRDQRSGTMSRYLYQLIYEKLLPHEWIHIHTPVQTMGSLPYPIRKDSVVLQKLKDYFRQRYLSPSALADYISCPLLFCLRHVYRLRPSKEIQEDADGGITGTLFHEAAFQLYSPFEGSLVTRAILESLEDKQELVERAVSEAFRKVLYPAVPPGQNPEPQGPYVILFDVLKKYLNQLIRKDMEETPFTLSSLEKETIINWNINIDGNDFIVRLGGKTDRLDKIGEKIRVIDYKTGSPKGKPEKLEQLTDPEAGHNFRTSLQALFYAMLLEEKYQDIPIQPLLYFMKNLFTDQFDPAIYIGESSVEDFRVFSASFRQLVHQVITEMLSPDIPFSQTQDPARCRNCDFIGICHRR